MNPLLHSAIDDVKGIQIPAADEVGTLLREAKNVRASEGGGSLYLLQEFLNGSYKMVLLKRAEHFAMITDITPSI